MGAPKYRRKDTGTLLKINETYITPSLYTDCGHGGGFVKRLFGRGAPPLHSAEQPGRPLGTQMVQAPSEPHYGPFTRWKSSLSTCLLLLPQLFLHPPILTGLQAFSRGSFSKVNSVFPRGLCTWTSSGQLMFFPASEHSQLPNVLTWISPPRRGLLWPLSLKKSWPSHHMALTLPSFCLFPSQRCRGWGLGKA